MPLVSVIMPVRNQARFLSGAVRSILDQTLPDLELLIVDDGSTDDTRNRLRALAEQDGRIRWFSGKGRGVAAALNMGIAASTGVFVARMDGDDIALSHRLERQVVFLDDHPDVGLCGGWIRTFGKRSERVRRYASDHATIESCMLFGNELAHPTVMARRSALDRHALAYDPEYRGCEDYELWSRAMRCFRMANVPEVLVQYREHETQETRHSPAGTNDGRDRVQARLVRAVYPGATSDDLRIHGMVGGRRSIAAKVDLLSAESWLCRLRAANDTTRVLPRATFDRTLSEQWFMTSYAAAGIGGSAWTAYWKSELSRESPPGCAQLVKFAWRCAARRAPVW